jgi:hypothetical protein
LRDKTIEAASDEEGKLLKNSKSQPVILTLPRASTAGFSRHPASTKSSRRPPTSTATRHKDKYYSDRELSLLQRKMENEGKFISTDAYFNKKINKMLDVSGDIEAIRPYSIKQAREEEKEKRTLTKLFLRRHTSEVKAPQHSETYMKEKIE